MTMTTQAAAFDDPKLVTAVVAAVASVVVAVISAAVSALSSRTAQRSAAGAARSLEEFKTELEEQSAERNARRDYEYEARKRLYEVCEPVLFQLTERSSEAYSRILNLAQACRNGDVRRDGGWLISHEGYYLTSTLYRLLTPIVLFRVLQENLTIVDLTLDRSISTRYTLAKLLGWSLTDAFEFARMAHLPYDPYPEVNRQEWERRLAERPHRVETAIEAMVVRSSRSQARPMSLGEFSVRYGDETSEIRTHLAPAANLFEAFHPSTRPVLWLILVAHAHIYSALIRTAGFRSGVETGEAPKAAVIPSMSPDERVLLDWRLDSNEASDEEVLVRPFDIAQGYLRMRLSTPFHAGYPTDWTKVGDTRAN